tara:strand:- start:368 stop:970 length:603 start_codon:yes stop_codon:yes gene_type:complete
MIEIYDNTHSLSSDITKNIARTVNNQQFFQTKNLFNDKVNNGDSTNNIITLADQAGVSTNVGDWLKYNSWETSITQGMFNSNSNMMVASDTGATILQDGYYKVTVNLLTQSNIDKTAVAFRLAKNDIMEGPISCIGNTLIDNNTAGVKIFAASGTVTWILNCSADDEISIYTSKYGASGLVQTSQGTSSLLIEYKGSSPL